MGMSAAWRWNPKLREWTWIALTCAVLLLGTVCAAEAGINVWTGSGYPFFDQFALAPGRPTTVYASIFGAENGWVYQSTDGGSTWDQIFMADPVEALAAYPGTPNCIYLMTLSYSESAPGSHVLRSVDGGATWIETATACWYLLSMKNLGLSAED